MDQAHITRRDFLRLSSIGFGALALAACGERPGAATPTAPAQLGIAPEVEPGAIVGDVLNFALKGDWPGRFGWVEFRLHAGFANGEKAYFIRTDASDKAFAEANGLVWAPVLGGAENAQGSTSRLYLFERGPADQLPILSTAPPQENYSPLWQVHQVRHEGTAVYDSEDALKVAAEAGEVTIEAQKVFVNYPVVKWPGGELSVDQEKKEYLGGGQLLEPVDTPTLTVTFKLHECFPGSRYIVTDTSAAPMAPMMSVSASSPVQGLVDGKATDKIWVFANGLAGSGVMGFQPAIFAHRAGDPLWSPFWDHFTLKWKDDVTPRVLRSEADLQAAVAAGEVEQFNGTPDTHPTGFVVNCPVPVLAPNTFSE